MSCITKIREGWLEKHSLENISVIRWKRKVIVIKIAAIICNNSNIYAGNINIRIQEYTISKTCVTCEGHICRWLYLAVVADLMAAALEILSTITKGRERKGVTEGTYARVRYLLRRPPPPPDRRDEFAPRRPRRGATTPTQDPRVSGTAAGMPAPHFDSFRGLRMRLLMAGRLVHIYRRS